ncbi:retrotransposon protein, putative, ty1-copia subclass [Tanacetum coccineum]
MLQDVISYLRKCFAMKDFGEAAYVLGIKICKDRSRRSIGLCQSAYIKKILNRINMENSKRGSIPMQDKPKLSKSQGALTPDEVKRMQRGPYASALGSIMYVNILKYLRNTKDMFLFYGGDIKRELKVACYTDVGYLTDVDDSKSQTGYVFILNGDAFKEAVLIRKIIFGLGVVPTNEVPMKMYCDNTRAIIIANEPGITKGVRHYLTKVYYLCEVIELGDIVLENFYTYNNVANPFTKALPFNKHFEHTKSIGLLPASSLM